jgi:hypothetical protein
VGADCSLGPPGPGAVRGMAEVPESVAEAENNPKTGGRIPMMAERSRRTADNNHHKA